MAVDSTGLPINFEITSGDVHDVKVALGFIEKLPRSKYVIADKGYGSEDLREQIVLIFLTVANSSG